MSVSILIEHGKNGAEPLIPFASEDFFNSFWYPRARQLGLPLILAMHPGFEFGAAALQPLIGELVAFEVSVVTDEHLSRELKQGIRERIAFICRQLEEQIGFDAFRGYAG